MMTKKERKIRGHQMALKNAQARGDKAGAAKQRDTLAKLGGAPAKKHTGKANPAPRSPASRKSSMRGGKRFKHNPDAYDFEKKWEQAKAAEEKVADAKTETKEAKAAEREAAKEARAEGTPAAKKEAAAAARKVKAAERREAKAKDAEAKAAKRIEQKAAAAAKRAAKKAQQAAVDADYPYRAAPAKPTKKASKGRKETTMAKKKRTKAERSAAAKKGAAKRKRNAAKKSTARKPAARKSPRRKAAKKASRKSSRSRSRFPKVPKAFKKTSSRVSIKAKSRKTGKRKTFTKTRSYKSNPMSDLGQLAVMGGGVLAGALLADLLRRFVVTMAPKGGKEPFYGNLASERIDSAHPTAMAYAAQGLLGVAGLGVAYAVRKKSPGAATFLAGVGIGALVQVGLDLFAYGVAPALLKSEDINDKNLGNRLFPLQQKHSQKYVNDVIAAENKNIEAGSKYKPDGNPAGVAGYRGVAGLPQGQPTRALPPAQVQGFRPQQTAQRGGQVAGIATQASGQVGCGGAGGCGGGGGMTPGCTGGRNCSCPSCSGSVSSIAPAAQMSATTAGAPQLLPSRAGNVNGPRALSDFRPTSFIPRVTSGRKAVAFGGRLSSLPGWRRRPGTRSLPPSPAPTRRPGFFFAEASAATNPHLENRDSRWQFPTGSTRPSGSWTTSPSSAG